MKRILTRIATCLTLTGILLVLLAACRSQAGSDPTGLTHYTPQDFISMQQFEVVNSQYPDTDIAYVHKDNSILYRTHMPDRIRGEERTIFYEISPERNREYVDGAWQTIATDDIDDYVQSMDAVTGKQYHNLQPANFRQTSDYVWEIDTDAFFRQAFRHTYEWYFGKDYTDAEFDAAFDETHVSMYGNLDLYTVTLDCTDPAQIRLTIAKRATDTTSAFTQVFTYRNVHTAEITLPEESA